MITLIKFLAGINDIIDSRPIYKLGQDGRNGQCDCIGLIIGAIRRAGGESLTLVTDTDTLAVSTTWSDGT